MITRNSRWGSGRAGFPRMKNYFGVFFLHTYVSLRTNEGTNAEKDSQQQAMAKQGKLEICRRRDRSGLSSRKTKDTLYVIDDGENIFEKIQVETHFDRRRSASLLAYGFPLSV